MILNLVSRKQLCIQEFFSFIIDTRTFITYLYKFSNTEKNDKKINSITVSVSWYYRDSFLFAFPLQIYFLERHPTLPPPKAGSVVDIFQQFHP